MGSIFVIFILLFISPHLLVSGDTTLIHNTCNNTIHYKLCLKSLKSNSSSSKADTKGLAVIIIGIAINSAKQTTSFLSSQLASTTNDSAAKKLIKDCADKYSNALDALQASLKELELMSFDYAYVRVSAARDYPSVCHNGYKRFPGLAYPVKLARREVLLEQMCDVALGIIDLIGW